MAWWVVAARARACLLECSERERETLIELDHAMFKHVQLNFQVSSFDKPASSKMRDAPYS